ncbi:MAG: DUF177 domain-containing protein [Myxococcales bacterium]|nr:DUF177 domain-containing protein [Myxococcales bacterium]
MPEFTLKIQDLDDDAKDLSFPLRHGWITESMERDGLRAAEGPEGQVRILVQRMGEELLAQTQIRGRVIVECARCLEDATLEIDVSVTTMMSRGPVLDEGSEASDLSELSDEEMLDESLPDRDTFSGDLVVFDRIVREHVLLEVPMQPLCRTECPGIEVPAHVRGPDFESLRRSAAGLDPRLAPLLELRAELPESED